MFLPRINIDYLDISLTTLLALHMTFDLSQSQMIKSKIFCVNQLFIATQQKLLTIVWCDFNTHRNYPVQYLTIILQ